MKGIVRAGIVMTILSLLVAGCGGPGVDTAKVTGNVTVGGSPMADIVVIFSPEAGGRPGTGVTDASGNFTLSTFGNGDGAVPGKHKVAFTMNARAPASSQPGNVAAAPPAPFNSKYTRGETSGITAEVVAGQTNEMPTWDLEK